MKNIINKKALIIFSVLILFSLAVSFTPLYARTIKMLKEASEDVFQVIGKLVVEGNTEMNGGLDIQGNVSMFGNWTSSNLNTVYQAKTDGFVIASVHGRDGHYPFIQGFSDENPNPTMQRAIDRGNSEGGVNAYASITFPVRKGDYWKVTGDDITNAYIYWIPLGR